MISRFERSFQIALSWAKENWKLWLTGVVSGLLANFALWSETLLNPDGMLTWPEYYAGDYELCLGRWMLNFYDQHILQGLSTSFLCALVVLSFFSLSALLIDELLQIKNSTVRYITTIYLCCSPFAAIHITSPFTADAYAISFFLAVAAVMCCVTFSNSFWGTFFGAICLAVSLGGYQANIGVTAGCCMMYIFLACFKTEKEIGIRKLLSLCTKMLLMGIAGALIYYGVLQYCLASKGLQLISYKGADQFGFLHIISNLGSTIKTAYIDFFSFFFGSDVVCNTFHTQFFNALLLIVGFVTLSFHVVKNRKNIRTLYAILFIMVFPIMLNLIDILAVGTTINLFTAGGMYCFFFFVIGTVEKTATEITLTKSKYLFRLVNVMISFGLIWNYVLMNNADAVVMRICRNMTYSVTERIFAQLENDPRYTRESKVLIIGNPINGSYKPPLQMYGRANWYAQQGMVWSGVTFCWPAFTIQFLGVENMPPMDQCYAIADSEQFANMPIYPNSGSIEVINDVFVVKFSE